MKIYLLKDVEAVGLAGEIIKVSDGFARNRIIPLKLGIEVTDANESYFKKREKTLEKRKDENESNLSERAKKIEEAKIVVKRKLHDSGKLYGAIKPSEVVNMLANSGIAVTKDQVKFDKSIKEKGTYQVIIKLSSRLQPKLTVQVVSE